jgi:pimeloyl-ACP methyl ester carboxylesterase
VRGRALLVHGLSSSEGTWWRVGPGLEARGWTVEAVTLAGHGGRPLGAVRSVGDLADDVADRHPDGATVVVGHSLGAVVALGLATRRPAYARGVVLEDPPGHGRPRPAHGLAAEHAREVALARADPDAAIASMLWGHPGWTRRDARSVLGGRLLTDPRVADLYLDDLTWDLPALVSGCPVPTAMVAARGRYSALLEPVRSEVLRLLPPGRVTELPGSHHVHLDHPDAWLDAVDAFADGLS